MTVAEEGTVGLMVVQTAANHSAGRAAEEAAEPAAVVHREIKYNKQLFMYNKVAKLDNVWRQAARLNPEP
eukprot:476053-Rhodomonas_salina.1